MREIKFRSWDKETSKMYAGNNLIVTFSGILEEVYVRDRNSIFELIDYKLMQYTGLNDINGKEVYEGDIVKIEDYFGEDIIGRVIYDEITASYMFSEGNEREYFQRSLKLESYVYYVIGNIYENQELVERI